MPIPKDIEAWKTQWDCIVNDKTFRKRFTKCGEYSSTSRRMPNVRGTVYIPSDDYEGHFIAYEIRGDTVYIFDSAALTNRYFLKTTHEILNNIVKKSRTRTHVMIDCHPQMHEEDSFCQTWSLAWLTPEYRSLVTQVATKHQSMQTLFTICKDMIERDCFRAPDEFLDFTRSMTFQMFSKIFED